MGAWCSHALEGVLRIVLEGQGRLLQAGVHSCASRLADEPQGADGVAMQVFLQLRRTDVQHLLSEGAEARSSSGPGTLPAFKAGVARPWCFT